jgi:hypothetical protein
MGPSGRCLASLTHGWEPGVWYVSQGAGPFLVEERFEMLCPPVELRLGL